MEQQPNRIRLKLPEQDLQCLTIGSDQPKKLQAWVDELPLMNMGETSRQLYQYIQELNRLQLPSDQRLALLEVVRPAILNCCTALSKHYLNQTLVLPEKARRVAGLAQSLQTHLAGGYKLAAVYLVKGVKSRGGKERLAMAIERAMSAMLDTLVRSYKLYFPVPRHLWLEMHQLYLLSQMHQLSDVMVTEPDAKTDDTSCALIYARALMMATAKPNQLRQQEIVATFQATASWCPHLDIKPAGSDADLFVFDLQQDRPPTYRTHVSVAGQESRYMDASELTHILGLVIKNEAPQDFVVPKGMTDNLVAHLQQAWGSLSERSFARVSQKGSVELCLGLLGLHGVLSGGMDFERLVTGGAVGLMELGTEDNPFLSSHRELRPGVPADDDAWSKAFDGGSSKMMDQAALDNIDLTHLQGEIAGHAQSSKANTKVVTITCDKVNASPGGYCLQLKGEVPSQLKAGEMMGIREMGDGSWALGVVRWVKQQADKSAQFGVELLAPKAVPIGARAVKKTGDKGNFMRALVLPAMEEIGQPATLIVPSVGFQANIKVDLAAQGRTDRVLLTRKVNGTAGFGQYEFRQVMYAGKSSEGGEEDFDSIWANL